MVLETALLQDLGFIILAGTLFAFLFKKIGQPLIVAYIFAGLLVGPIGLGLIVDYANINVLAELGVAFLLFALGLEIDFSKLWQFKKPILIGGIGQITLTVLLISLLTQGLGFTLIESVYMGFIVAFSSTVIVVKLLTQRKQLNSLEGKLIVGYVLVQDLVAVLALPLLANPNAFVQTELFIGILGSMALLLVAGGIVSRFIFPRLMQYAAKSQEIFYLTILSSFFFFTALSSYLHFSIAVGAFIAGLVLSKTSFNHEALHIIQNIRDLFATVFFVSLGMQLTLLPTQANLFILIAMLLVVFILNPIIFSAVNLFSGFGLRASLFIGLALAQASEFSFILASQGNQLGFISTSNYNLAIWMIILSMIATPYMMNRSDKLYGFLRRQLVQTPIPFFQRKLLELEKLPEHNVQLENHIVIAGAGVFGTTIAEELKHNSVTVIIVEQDPDLVEKFIQKGFFAVFASRHNQEVWEKVHLEKAKLFITTIPEVNGNIKIIEEAKKHNRQLVVFTRAHHYGEALELYRAGADWVVMPQVIGSNYTLKTIQEYLQTGKKPSQGPLSTEYYRVLEEKAKEEKKEK